MAETSLELPSRSWARFAAFAVPRSGRPNERWPPSSSHLRRWLCDARESQESCLAAFAATTSGLSCKRHRSHRPDYALPVS